MASRFWTKLVKTTQQNPWFSLRCYHCCKTMPLDTYSSHRKRLRILSAIPLNIFECSMTSLIHFTTQNQVLLIWLIISASIKWTNKMRLKFQCICLILWNTLKKTLTSSILKFKMVKNQISESKKLSCTLLIKLVSRWINKKSSNQSFKNYFKTTFFKNSIQQTISYLKEQQSFFRNIIN